MIRSLLITMALILSVILLWAVYIVLGETYHFVPIKSLTIQSMPPFEKQFAVVTNKNTQYYDVEKGEVVTSDQAFQRFQERAVKHLSEIK